MERRTTGSVIRALTSGLAVAIGLTLAGMLALAVVVVYARLGDSTLLTLNQVLKLAAIFAGVRAAVGAGGRYGFALGAIVGLIYIALGYGICALSGQMTLSGSMLATEFAVGAGIGALFGTLSANLPVRKKRRRAA